MAKDPKPQIKQTHKKVGKQNRFYILALRTWNSNYIPHLTTITVELGFLWDFVLLNLKTNSLYHENLRSVHLKNRHL